MDTLFINRELVIRHPLTLVSFLQDLLEISIDSFVQTDPEPDDTESVYTADSIEEDDIPAEYTMEKIEEEISQIPELKDNHSFNTLWRLLKDFPVLTFVVEPYYVDKNYRDTYYSHYSSKHFSYKRYCKRLFIFNGDLTGENQRSFVDIPSSELQKVFMGCIVIRPLDNGKIGRTLLTPYYFCNSGHSGDEFVRFAKYNVTVSGKRLKINAFPYSMQDGETTSCAENTIGNLLDYFSKRYVEYKYLLPSEIISVALKHGYDRKLPTKGLDYRTISRVLMEAGFYPCLYEAVNLSGTDKMRRMFHYYIESGIPVAAGMQVNNSNDRHSIIGIGHKSLDKSLLTIKQYGVAREEDGEIWFYDSANAVSQYIVMDDHDVPYSEYTWEHNNGDYLGNYKFEHLLVPLYKRMYLEASDAYDICTSILADGQFGIQSFIPGIGSFENPFVIRLFMASARGLKRHRIEHFSKVNEEVRGFYINTPFPRFVWVCEIYTVGNYPKKCSGEIIVDATASAYANSSAIIILHFPNNIFFKLPEDSRGLKFSEGHYLESWEEFAGYRGNLHDTNERDDDYKEVQSK